MWDQMVTQWIWETDKMTIKIRTQNRKTLNWVSRNFKFDRFLFFIDRKALYGDQYQDASNGLCSLDMLEKINKTHPREKVQNDESNKVEYRKHSICKTSVGFHDCCSRNNRKSEFDQYGVGTVLYFQFLKYMGFLFMLMFVLSIPSMLFFIYGTELTDSSLTKVVTAASLGNLGSSKPVCKSGTYDIVSETVNTNNPTAYIELSCPFGNLWSIT